MKNAAKVVKKYGSTLYARLEHGFHTNLPNY